MKQFFLLCLSGFAMCGCAGLVAPFVNNPYAGTYTGTFTDTSGRTGPASITLTNIGNVYGTLTNTALNQQGGVSGSVNTSLNFNGTITFPSFSQNVSGTFTSAGTQVAGTLTGSNGYSIMIDVNDQSGKAHPPNNATVR